MPPRLANRLLPLYSLSVSHKTKSLMLAARLIIARTTLSTLTIKAHQTFVISTRTPSTLTIKSYQSLHKTPVMEVDLQTKHMSRIQTTPETSRRVTILSVRRPSTFGLHLITITIPVVRMPLESSLPGRLLPLRSSPSRTLYNMPPNASKTLRMAELQNAHILSSQMRPIIVPKAVVPNTQQDGHTKKSRGGIIFLFLHRRGHQKSGIWQTTSL